MSVNKVILLGRLGQDPELRYTPGGMAVCHYSIATSESWKDKNTGDRQERTEWHRIVVWGKTAELCNQYLSKGRQVYLEGRIQTRSWEDKSGVKRYTTEVVANSVQFLGSMSDNNNSAGGSYGGAQRNSAPMGDQGSSDGGGFPSSGGGSSAGQSFTPENDFTADDIPF